MSWRPSFGAIAQPDGVRFRLWAPAAHTLTLLHRHDGQTTEHAPVRREDGIWETFVGSAAAGDRYAYVLDGGRPWPDPSSRYQPDGVHGWSQIVDAGAFGWTDQSWRGLDPARLVIYELHVGTFAGRGTFADVASRLEYLRELGITALELMPLGDFPGRRNWGYDVASLFAPSRAYGTPDDLRRLVDGAHAAGLGVLVDVVYNHLGPEGAYLYSFSPQFLTRKHKTPWGSAVNLDDDGCEVVRRLLKENALHWIHEYHADGLRLDATHALIDESDRPFVAELAAAVHESDPRRPMVFAEDHRNLATIVTAPEQGGWGLDGVWADDFHHVLRRMLAGDTHGYYMDYRGDASELAETIRRGWLFVGQCSAYARGPRGTDPSHVPMRKAITCVQNHDQIGNRACGDRLHHVIDPAAWRAAVALLLACPTTPLLFMGQEWSASTPFQFFTDFEASLGRQVTEGRRREFEGFPGFKESDAGERCPDPQAGATFDASRLCWDELADASHNAVLTLHRVLLQLRRERRTLQASDACTCTAEAVGRDSVIVYREAAGGELPLLVCARLRGAGPVVIPERIDGRVWRTVLTTEEERFAEDATPPIVDVGRRAIEFARPGTVILESIG